MTHPWSRAPRSCALLLSALALAGLAGCGQPADESSTPELEAPQPAVSTLSFPAHWLVQRLAGDLVDAECVLPPGEDAPFWQPPAELVASLADADLIVANGAGFEKWIETATLPQERLVLSAANIDLIETEGVTHSHGPGGEHSHGGIDPHTWSDPLSYLTQASEIADALSLLVDEAGQNAIQANLDELRAELEALDAEYREALAPLSDTPMASNHPSFNYLARRYGLEISALEFDPERAPDPDELASFESWSAGREAPILLWEAAPVEDVKTAFPESVHHVVLDPLEQPTADGSYDYLAQARANIDTWRSLSNE